MSRFGQGQWINFPIKQNMANCIIYLSIWIQIFLFTVGKKDNLNGSIMCVESELSWPGSNQNHLFKNSAFMKFVKSNQLSLCSTTQAIALNCCQNIKIKPIYEENFLYILTMYIFHPPNPISYFLRPSVAKY